MDNAGNVLIGGFFSDSIYIDDQITLYSQDSYDDYFYCKFDSDGILLWAKQISSIENALSGRIFSIEATDNNYYLGGLFSDSTIFETDTLVSINHSYDIHIISTDLDGKINWIRKLGGNGG